MAPVQEAASAPEQIVERYLQDPRFQRTDDPRSELFARFARRMPEALQTSDAAELEAAFRDILDMLDIDPVSAGMLASERAAWRNGVFENDDYAEMLANHARSAAVSVGARSHDLEVFDGLDGGKGRYTSDQLARLDEDVARRRTLLVIDPEDTQTQALVFGAMLELVDTMSGEQQRERLAGLMRAAPYLSRAPLALRAAWDAILERVRMHPEMQRELLVTLADAASRLPRNAIQPRADALACARAAWEDGEIDGRCYADILDRFARLIAFADLVVGERLVNELIECIEQLPASSRGQLYGLMASCHSARLPESRRLFLFDRAWRGLMTLSPEQARIGIKLLLGAISSLDPETKAPLAETMLDAADRAHFDFGPLFRHDILPFIASLPSTSTAELLGRALSRIDASASMTVDDFLPKKNGDHVYHFDMLAGVNVDAVPPAKRWQQVYCEQIFDHMYPITMAIPDDRERANELVDLTKLASGLSGADSLSGRFNLLAGGLEGVPMAFRFESLRGLQELAERLRPRSSESTEAFARLQRLGADELASHETVDAWQQAFPPTSM
ncbi:hypothetical protein LJR230_003816 [Trinickia sp. LjRoot230]|uniref:hypothetical protein n=1 Tax=Trinickia sp. LjRoot230 TaxID=3342288 RepID=UPI003ECE2C9D